MNQIPCQISEIRQALLDLSNAVKARPARDEIVEISATKPLVLDFKGRYYVMLFTANALTLSLEDLGSITVTANSWTDISFVQAMRIFATGQATNVPVLVRCTDVK